ncbi:Uma2 family endonuclease [Sciscionella sediminilitoris]|uniref:Uma2 family endonuclease n=1 Tax=Sciscionella sediminilitoris TaxID=1445613 RepID=UPI00068DEDF5|nr:Uma2 family endonuclease [Sciscionella sp. SE31]
MSPPSALPHNTTLAELTKTLVEVTERPRLVYPRLGVAIPTRSSVFIRDLCVTDSERIRDGGDPVDASLLALVVEVTSPSNARQDRSLKLWGYAHGRVPL